jgi:hypothetical protein
MLKLESPRWIRDCEISGHYCVSEIVPSLPRRVLEVQSSEGQPALRLIETKGMVGRYITLSHCWGTQKGSRPPVITSSSTLASRLRYISWDSLSKTFQDAVTITRALDIRYIWIDSLCIIQDNTADWNEQASLMVNIYANSYLTICATRATDGSIGCFSSRPETKKIPTMLSRQGGDPVNISVRKFIDHDPYSFTIQRNDIDRYEEYPLLTRGWCLQERLLSPRIVHYGSNEMIWQCKKSSLCECGGSTHAKQFSRRYNKAMTTNDPVKTRLLWRDIVQEYTDAKLTKASDILPALSGLSSRMSMLSLGRYVAGLWEKELMLWLNWKTDTDEQRPRPAVYTAPSFSWASRIGRVSWHAMMPRDLASERFSMIEVLEIRCDTREGQPFGEVSYAFLRLKGYLIPSIIEQYTGVDPRTELLDKFQVRTLCWEQVYVGPDFDVEDDGTRLGKSVFCLPLMMVNAEEATKYMDWNVEEVTFNALILERVAEGEYRRLGIVPSHFVPKIPVRQLETLPREVFKLL